MAMRSWWSRRWAEVFRTSAIVSRVSRGRQYARAGAVMGLTIGRGTVQASVQGSRKRPYSVTVWMDPLSSSEWREVARVLASESGLSAQVLSGRLPERLETALASRGVSLFPKPSGRRPPTLCSCSCPDEANPCKHICAVFDVLLDRLEADPLLTFVLRGKTVDEVLQEVRRYRGASSEGIAAPAIDGTPPFEGVPAIAGAPSLSDAALGALPAKHVEFWSLGDAKHPSSVSGSLDMPAGRRSAPAQSSGSDIRGRSRSETGTGTTGFTLPPLPFVDRQSLGRRAIEQVYLLAARAAEQYLEQMDAAARVGTKPS